MTPFLPTMPIPPAHSWLPLEGAGSTFASLLPSLTLQVATQAGPVLIATLWQGLALAAMTALCLRVTLRSSAALRFMLWSAALLLICVLPSAFPGTGNTPLTPVLHAAPGWSFAVAALWFTLSLIRAADLARHALRLRSLNRSSIPVPVDPVLATLLRAHRGARLCTSTQLDRPGVIGFLHPRILIPAWLFAQLTAPELEQIVLHEIEHLRRRDDWLNLLQKLALVIFPLNPALYWIERRLCLERELACDEGVIRRTRAPRLYATCLTRLAEYGLARNTTAGHALSLALGFLERQSELARRVAGILQGPRTLSRGQSLAFTGTVAALLLTGSVELARCPQFVSFAPTTVTTTVAAPPQAPETSARQSSATPVLYRNPAYMDATVPHLVPAALTQVRKPLRKAQAHRTHPPTTAQRALTEQAMTAQLLVTGFPTSAPAQAPVTPTLVRYTLVHVEGGWFLLQL